MLLGIADCQSDHASSDDEEDGEHNDDEVNSGLRKLSKDDKPGLVMGYICRTLQQCIECIE
jgi:hypothetical protein